MWTSEPYPLFLSLFSIMCKSIAALKDKHDLLVIPGGAQGAETISKHPSVQELVRRYIERGKLVGMICAGVCRKLFIFFQV
jgi:putative intracellular protease/amidase